MKKILLLLLTASAFATTTITGNIKTLGTTAVGTASFVRFWLRGCGGNQPRISGTGVVSPSQGGVFFFDFAANSSGAISGTLYSTRDVTGLLGGDIECGGSTTAVWYGMQVFLNGKGGPEVAIVAKNSATLDISNVTPITVNPVVVAPTGDSTYLRLDDGNGPLAGFNVANPGVFTTGQMNDYLTVLLNGADIQTLFQLGQGGCGGGGCFATQGFTSAIKTPAGSTVHQVNAISALAENDGASNTVAEYQFALNNVAGGFTEALNPVVQSVAGKHAGFMGNEFDYNTLNANDVGQVIDIIGAFGAQPTGDPTFTTPGNLAGVGINAPVAFGGIGGPYYWPVGFVCQTSSILSGYPCVLFPPSFSGVSQTSQTAIFTSTKSDGSHPISKLFEDQFGHFNVQSSDLATNGYNVVSSNGTELLCNGTLPVISGFNTNGTLGANANGNCSFFINVGSGVAGSTGTITLPTAASGWTCFAQNQSRADLIQQSGNGVTSVTLTNFGTTFSATNWTNADLILVTCSGR